MTESMVEKVARSIAGAQSFAWGLNYDTCLKEDREHCQEIARAAIKAMRGPTQHMANAGWSAIAGHADDPQGAAWPIFNAMIDAALDEKAPAP